MPASWILPGGWTNGWTAGENKQGPGSNALLTSKSLPAITSGLLLDGAGTIIMSDYIDPNACWGGVDTGSYLTSTSAQIQNTTAYPYTFPTDGSLLHGRDMFNYAFADGHVEFLNRNSTVGRTNSSLGLLAPNNRLVGMWSINPTD